MAHCAEIALVQEAAQGEASKAHTFFETEYKLNHLLGTSKKPVISILNGITSGSFNSALDKVSHTYYTYKKKWEEELGLHGTGLSV